MYIGCFFYFSYPLTPCQSLALKEGDVEFMLSALPLPLEHLALVVT
jgi:hypothetical protein